ncbi:hypothetical protein OG689_10765 [Kitasatospora sp. NBC_00240]|uniref:hypothetical protein n=1 Tax=Kitasatospora sp. NBC_00240 TaxID=2903567 RepID=UPI00224D5A0C|nr:hypothetical protein [Kitasatospora sp. NBC_00240]MCX5209765.1 hypothetical protein [Kitasatospora sp. NBC_00240]
MAEPTWLTDEMLTAAGSFTSEFMEQRIADGRAAPAGPQRDSEMVEVFTQVVLLMAARP